MGVGYSSDVLKNSPIPDNTQRDKDLGYYNLDILTANSLTTNQMNNIYSLNQVSTKVIDEEKQFVNAKVAILVYQPGISSNTGLQYVVGGSNSNSFLYAVPAEKIFDANADTVVKDNIKSTYGVIGSKDATFKLVIMKIGGGKNNYALQEVNTLGNGIYGTSENNKYISVCVSNDFPIFNADDIKSCGATSSFDYDSSGFVNGIKIGPWVPKHNLYLDQDKTTWQGASYYKLAAHEFKTTGIIFRLAVIEPSPFMKKYFKYTYTIPGNIQCCLYTSKDPDIAFICNLQGLSLGSDTANTVINNLIITDYNKYKTDITTYCSNSATNCDEGFNSFCNASKINSGYTECGCFVPQNEMNNFWNSLYGKVLPEAKPIINNSTKCFYPLCYNSPIKSFKIKKDLFTCPETNKCISELQIDNNNKVIGSASPSADFDWMTKCGSFLNIGNSNPNNPVYIPTIPSDILPPSPRVTPSPSNPNNVYYVIGLLILIIAVILYVFFK